MDRKVFFALVYFAALAGILVVMAMLLWPFMSSIAWAGVIALAAYPLHRLFLRLFKGRETMAAIFSTAVVVLTVAVPLLILAILFAGEAANVLSVIQQSTAAGHVPGRQEVLANPTVAQLMERLQPYLTNVDLKPILLSAMKAVSTVAVGASKAILLNTLAFIIKFFIMVAVLFFAFRDGKAMTEAFWEVMPLKQADKAVLLDTVRRVVSAVLYGIVLTCVVQGILGGVGFALAGLPSPIFFGAIMIICAFIPLIGTALVWVPGVLYLLAVGSYGKAIFLTVWGAAVISSIDNFVRPFFISGKAKIPLLVILLGVLGGLATMGFLGLIVGPLLFAIALDLFRVYRTEIFTHLKPDLDGNPGDGA
jgi:predicted PurR-regulated permease PerM